MGSRRSVPKVFVIYPKEMTERDPNDCCVSHWTVSIAQSGYLSHSTPLPEHSVLPSTTSPRLSYLFTGPHRPQLEGAMVHPSAEHAAVLQA